MPWRAASSAGFAGPASAGPFSASAHVCSNPSAPSGEASFSSYRDPNVASTLTNYDGTGAFLRANPLGPAELSKAIIGAVGDLDSPQSVDSRGYTSMVRHMLGITEESRQVWREQVLGTTAADFVNFAERIDQVAEIGSVAAVASEKVGAQPLFSFLTPLTSLNHHLAPLYRFPLSLPPPPSPHSSSQASPVSILLPTPPGHCRG